MRFVPSRSVLDHIVSELQMLWLPGGGIGRWHVHPTQSQPNYGNGQDTSKGRKVARVGLETVAAAIHVSEIYKTVQISG